MLKIKYSNTNSYRNKVLAYLLVTILFSAGVFLFVKWHYNQQTKITIPPHQKKTSKTKKNTSTKADFCAKGTEQETLLFFQDFIAAFNTHNPKKIDPFINPECLLFYFDGYYPILTFTNTIKNEIDWYNDTLSTKIIYNQLPKYLGDNQFKERGFFYSKNPNFNLNDFDNSYTNHSKQYINKFKSLEKDCNYKASVTTIDNSKVFTFYFSINKNRKKLIGMSYNFQQDTNYCNPNMPFIAFKNKKDIEDFIKTTVYFCDNKNDGFIDFGNKTLTYWDFKEQPFVFDNFNILDIQKKSSAISIAEIKFTNSNTNTNFVVTLSNKGVFFIPPMGARPPYEYKKCPSLN